MRVPADLQRLHDRSAVQRSRPSALAQAQWYPAFAKSCVSAANSSTARSSPSSRRAPRFAAAASTTSIVWMPTSPSGCHSGSCGTPLEPLRSQENVRSSRVAFEILRDAARMRGSSIAHFMNSSATRSCASVEYSCGDGAAHLRGRGIEGQIEAAGELHSSQTLADGSSRKSALVARSTRFSRSSRPPKKSSNSFAIGS